MKKSIGLAFAVLLTAVVAAGAQGREPVPAERVWLVPAHDELHEQVVVGIGDEREIVRHPGSLRTRAALLTRTRANA